MPMIHTASRDDNDACVVDAMRLENETLRRKLHAAQNQTERLEKLLSGSRDIISFVDRDYVYREVNQQYLRAYCTSRENIIGRTVPEMIGADVFEKVIKQNLDRCLAGEDVFYQAWFEHPGLGRTLLEVSYLPFREEDGGVSGVIVNARDITQAKAFEEQLRAKHELLFNLLESLPTPIHLQRPDYSVSFANRRFRDLFGNVEGKRCYEIMALGDTPCHYCHTRSVFETGAPIECEWTDIKGRVFQVYIYPFQDTDGSPLALKLSVDITERKRIEQRLKTNEKRLQLALESTSDGLWDWNIRTGAAYYSPRWHTLLGYEPDSMQPTFGAWVELLHPDDGETYVAKLLSHIHGGGHATETEFRMRTKSGGWRWVLHRGRIVERDANGGAARLIGTLIDITERKCAEERTLQHKKRLEALLNMSLMTESTIQELLEFVLEEAVKATNSEIGMLGFIDAGQDVMVLHSWSANVVRNCSIQNSLLHFPIESAGLWAGAIRHRGPFLVNDYAAFHGLEKKGTPEGHAPLRRFLSVPVLDEGKVVAVAGVANKPDHYDSADSAQLTLLLNGMWDHIKRRRSNELLVNAKEEAERANCAKSQFLANMSHELRTPLSGILGLTDLLLNAAPRQDQTPYLDMLAESSQTLLALINDILDFSKIEARRMELRPVDFDLRLTLEKLLGPFLLEASKKGCALTLSIAPDTPPRLHGDPIRLGQVLVNLLCNAIKFTEKGAIGLEVARVPGPGQSLTLLFSVSDTGVGIPADMHDAIFDCFTQGDGSYSKRYHGTGLGLAICNELVRLFGGEIQVQSEINRGSVFSFTAVFLAPQAPADQPRAPAALHPDTASRKLSLLLAEDNKLNLVVFSHFLKAAGHTLVTVNDGRQAVEALGRQRFDCVLMDVQMPDMDGVAATRAIRADRSGRFDPTIPIIGFTAYAMKEDRENFLAAGMNDALAKPVSMSKLLRAVYNALASRPTPGEIRPNSLFPDCIDEDKLYAAFQGKPELFREIKQLFEDSVASNLNAISAKLQAPPPCDFEAVATAAHALANSAMVVRSQPAMDCARSLERAARGNADQETRDCFAPLETILAHVRARLGAIQI